MKYRSFYRIIYTYFPKEPAALAEGRPSLSQGPRREGSGSRIPKTLLGHQFATCNGAGKGDAATLMDHGLLSITEKTGRPQDQTRGE